jgi:hypothetical protein
MVCKFKFKTTLIQSRASSFCLMSHCKTYFTQSKVSRQDEIFISVMPILAIQALDGGISSSTNTMTRSLTPPTSPHARTHPSNMTFVSYDPSWWPLIDSELFTSYWTGLSYQSVISRSNIDLHCAVAAVVVVVYDLGEQDVVPNPLPFL